MVPTASKRGAQDPGICAQKVSRNCTIEDGSNTMSTPLKAKAVVSQGRQAEGSKVLVPPSNAGIFSHKAMTQHVVETTVEHPQFDFSSQAESSSHFALVVLELYARSAMLSAILKRDGFDTIPF